MKSRKPAPVLIILAALATVPAWTGSAIAGVQNGTYAGAVHADPQTPVSFEVGKNANGKKRVTDIFANNVFIVCAGVEDRVAFYPANAKIEDGGFKSVSFDEDGGKLVAKGTFDSKGTASGILRFFDYDTPDGACDTFVQHWAASPDV